MQALSLFVATFASVFALGFQSQNVNQGHYISAGITSLFIGGGHIFLYKLMPNSGPLEWAAYFAGGVIGITSSMYVHRRTVGRKRLDLRTFEDDIPMKKDDVH